jgi:hypothetical protein
MRTLLKTLDRWPESERRAIAETAEAHRAGLRPLTPAWTFDEDAG